MRAIAKGVFLYQKGTLLTLKDISNDSIDSDYIDSLQYLYYKCGKLAS